MTQPLASVFSIFRANVMNMLTIARNLFYDNDKYVILSITEIHITAYVHGSMDLQAILQY